MRRLVLLGALVAVLAAAAATLGFGARADAARQDTKLTLVAYSTPKEAFSKLIPAFQATPAGQGVSFDQSYGASGDQARAVVEGLKADVVDLSLEPDMTHAREQGPRREDLEQEPVQGHHHALGRRLRRARRQPEEAPHLGTTS